MTLKRRKQESGSEAEQHHAVQRLERSHQPPMLGEEDVGAPQAIIALSEYSAAEAKSGRAPTRSTR